jgi:hypothetical protein
VQFRRLTSPIPPRLSTKTSIYGAFLQNQRGLPIALALAGDFESEFQFKLRTELKKRI